MAITTIGPTRIGEILAPVGARRDPSDVLLRARRFFVRAASTLASVAIVAFLSTSLTYLLLYLTPINAADQILGENGTPAEIHQLAVALGTNKPFVDQYWTWLSNALHGNLGSSYFTHISVSHSIGQRFPVDLSIATMSIILAIILGFSGGIIAARNRGRLLDRTVTALASLGTSIPEFWLAMVLIIIFAVTFHVLPSGGYVGPSADFGGWLQHAILPAFSLAVIPAAGIARQLRTGLVDELDQNYVVGAVVRGLPPNRVLLRHALRNASGPAVASLGLYIPQLIGGAIIAETVFGLPGLGQYALEGAQGKDMPVIQGVIIVLIIFTLVTNVIVNAILGWLRPGTKV
jgi:peptide/nickel transport system permease protein